MHDFASQVALLKRLNHPNIVMSGVAFFERKSRAPSLSLSLVRVTRRERESLRA